MHVFFLRNTTHVGGADKVDDTIPVFIRLIELHPKTIFQVILCDFRAPHLKWQKKKGGSEPVRHFISMQHFIWMLEKKHPTV